MKLLLIPLITILIALTACEPKAPRLKVYFVKPVIEDNQIMYQICRGRPGDTFTYPQDAYFPTREEAEAFILLIKKEGL